jgi:selenocysteine-specific elongation factor
MRQTFSRNSGPCARSSAIRRCRHELLHTCFRRLPGLWSAIIIVGTAGHIDHGKTALVRALTGIDADRLPEEKRRGITIELGFAAMATPDGGQISFVDVPGHEKLVRTMVAGASGIDYALLLVAADDGVMPQTVEHLTILSLLGVRRGAAVITKIDRVDDGLLQERKAQVHALLHSTGLSDFPVLRAAALRGDGLDALRALLFHEAQRTPPAKAVQLGFRMGLDRAFTIAGIGTVVAGSIVAGSVRVGDTLCLAHASEQPYRVRSLHVHNHAVESAYAGQRCAIGLAGLERSAVQRGQMLCDPHIAQGVLRVDVWLQVAATEVGPLRSGTLVHLHAATQECMATVAVLGQASIPPGTAGLAQLVVQQPLHAWHGERFVLRDASASRTVAGGSVLDTEAPTRYRQTPQRLAYLQTQRAPDPAVRLRGALAHAPFGLDSAEWLRSSGLHDWPFDATSMDEADFAVTRNWIIARASLTDGEGAVRQALRAFHAQYPEEIGPGLQRLRRLAAPRMSEAIWCWLIERMAADGMLTMRNGFVHLAEHGIALHTAEKVVAERALPLLLDGRFDPPWVRDIAAAIQLPEIQVRQVLMRMAKGGNAHQVVKDLYYHPHSMQQLAAIARRIGQQGVAGNTAIAGAVLPAADSAWITAAAFRDATGLGRKRAIQILEFFDRIGFLRRVGDVHLLRTGTLMFPMPGS